MFWSFQKGSSQYLIKPIVHWYFWGHFCEMAPKSIKSIRFSVKVQCVLRLCKTSKTTGKTTFWSFQKGSSKYRIKPVVHWYFWGYFCEMAPKSIKVTSRGAGELSAPYRPDISTTQQRIHCKLQYSIPYSTAYCTVQYTVPYSILYCTVLTVLYTVQYSIHSIS